MIDSKNKNPEEVKTIDGNSWSRMTVFQNRKLIDSKINTLKRFEFEFINSVIVREDLFECVDTEITEQDVKDLNYEKCSELMEVNYSIWNSCMDEVSWITNEDRYIDLHKTLHFQLLKQLIQNKRCIEDNQYSETFTDWDLRHLNSCIKVTKGLFKMINDTRILFIGRHGKGLTPCGVKTDRTNVELYLNKINEVTRYQKDGDYYSGNWKIYKKIEDLILDSSSDRD